jgi:signal transduction histidine kinase
MRAGADIYWDAGWRVSSCPTGGLDDRRAGAGPDAVTSVGSEAMQAPVAPGGHQRAPADGARHADARARTGAWDDEVRHDALAALLGIEAAARSLAHHRHLLSAEQVDELSDGLVAEVERLKTLLDQRVAADAAAGRAADEPAVAGLEAGLEAGDVLAPGEPAGPPPGAAVRTDLRDAVGPVVACARAVGQVVDVAVEPNLEVACPRHTVARVLLTLLANARRHAPGSPVEVRATVHHGHVALRVEDRGPGVPQALRTTLFARGVRSDTTGGSGFGLCTARLLMSGHGGWISHAPRPGGGSSFVVRLRRWAPESMKPDRRALGGSTRSRRVPGVP